MSMAGMIDSAASFVGSAAGAASDWNEDVGFDTLSGGFGVVSAGANGVSGIAKLIDGDMRGGVGTLGSAVVEAMSSGTEVAGQVPLVGGVAQFLGGVGNSLYNHDQADEGYFYNDQGDRNDFYAGLGDTALGMIHSSLQGTALAAASTGAGAPIAATLGGIDLALSCGEAALDGVGLAAGAASDLYGWATETQNPDMYFGASDVTGGMIHAGADLMDAIVPYDIQGAIADPMSMWAD